MASERDVRGWASGLDGVVDRIAPRFGRVEPRRRATAYLHGLLAPVARKNGWQLAEAAGDATPDGVQEFLSRVQWDADAVRDDLQAYVVEHLGDPDAVLVLDETGFLKKGTKSAGVQRQYTGTAGRIENAQVGVFLGCASPHGRALIDRALYLPESWVKDPVRCKVARIPDDAVLTTKPKQGLEMLERARAAGVPFAWIAGDSVYGADSAIRRWAEGHRRGYVLAVTSGQRLGQRPVTAWIEDLADAAWQRLSAGDGAKGPRLYDWAHLPYNGGADGFACALLVRRSIADPEKATFYLTHAPQGTALAELVRVAGTRWSIESLFEQGWAAKRTDGRSGAGPLRGALLGRVAPPHHALDVRPGLPRRGPPPCRAKRRTGRRTGRHRGVWTRQTSVWTCCRSPCPRSGGSSQPSRSIGHPGPTPPCDGQPGDDATSNAPSTPTGTGKHKDTPLKPGCSTRAGEPGRQRRSPPPKWASGHT